MIDNLSKKMRAYLDKLVYEYGDQSLTPVYVEKGVYVFDYHVEPVSSLSKEKQVGAFEDELMPQATSGDSPEGGKSSSSGNHRQPRA